MLFPVLAVCPVSTSQAERPKAALGSVGGLTIRPECVPELDVDESRVRVPWVAPDEDVLSAHCHPAMLGLTPEACRYS